MAKEIQLALEIGANFSEAVTLPSTQTGRTHRAHIRETIGSTTVKMAFSTGAGNITLSDNTVTLTAGADVTELLNLATDSAFWVIDIESIGATAADVRREARGTVLVTRDITRTTEADPAASALGLVSYSEAQTLTDPQKAQAIQNIGAATQSGLDSEAQIREFSDNALAAAVNARAPLSHTHALSDLTQSGATSGQVPTWSGTAWAPATPSSGGGMAIGGAITGAANNRILQSNGSGNLAQQSTWYFDALAFGAAQPSAQCLRTTDGGGGYLASTGGGVLLGRTDDGPQLFVGFYTGGGPVVHVNSGYRFGNNPNDLRLNDAAITRRAADLIEGAALAMRAYTVATLPDAATWINAPAICTNEVGGRVPVFSDGTNWRRVTDRAIAS